ncbi:hypothetical protein LGK95_07640 [Clostridium algoriphilum]|nr:hypothetical protein [Clostridium algoriphilum]MCB2293392.1 hypothetical protein [Clostridium algoriphilum]
MISLYFGYNVNWLGPAIGSYIIYLQFNEDFGEGSFVKFVFGKKQIEKCG